MGSRRGQRTTRAERREAERRAATALEKQAHRPGFSLVRLNRDLDFDPPLTGRVKDVSRAIVDALSARGCRTRQPTATTIEFDGPKPWSFPPSLTRHSAALVAGGTVTLVPAEGRIRLEIRFDEVRTYAWPAVLMYILGWGTGLTFALTAAAVLAVLWVPRYVFARQAYLAWVRDAARGVEGAPWTFASPEEAHRDT
ncbi:MAG TPA: hypothetical protein VEX86_22420 [Longimicrobium sp.]|nr:hypothetical protein [Longimicrobium sp.]